MTKQEYLKQVTIGNVSELSGHIELKDSANYYFLNVDSFLPAGEVEPYEYAYKTAKEMLVNLKRISFIGEVKSSLYNEALKEKRIIYY